MLVLLLGIIKEIIEIIELFNDNEFDDMFFSFNCNKDWVIEDNLIKMNFR